MALDPIDVLLDAHQLGRHQTGNETYLRGLLSGLRSLSGVRIRTLVEREALDDAAVGPPFGIRRVPRSGSLRLAAMAMAARARDVDVVHAIYFAPVLAGKPVVLTVHDISFELHPEFFGRKARLRDTVLIRNGARRAAAVITVSETSRRDILEHYGLAEDRVVAIHNGVDARFLALPPRAPAEIGDRPIRILAIGTLQPRKNLLRLLEAVTRVGRIRPVALRIVGPDGYQADEIRARLQDSADVAVEIAGYVGDDALVAEYRAADMLVYPSIYEGFGLPVVEAMATGLPVVTSNGGSLPEIAGDAALIVDPYDDGAIADAIMRLGDDIDLWVDLSAKGRSRAAGFTWETAAHRHVDVYRSVVGA